MEKIYIASGKEKAFDNGGSIIAQPIDLSKIIKNISPDMLQDNIKDFVYFSDNGGAYLRTNVCKKREVDQYGKTHYTVIDAFMPNAEKEQESDCPF